MSDVLGPATLAATQSISLFTTLLPPLTDVRRADPVENPDIAADVRMGEIAAVSITLGLGAVTSALTKSNIPVITAAFASLGLVFLYEWTLRHDRPMERPAATVVTLVPAYEEES